VAAQDPYLDDAAFGSCGSGHPRTPTVTNRQVSDRDERDERDEVRIATFNTTNLFSRWSFAAELPRTRSAQSVAASLVADRDLPAKGNNPLLRLYHRPR
jgi:hypothetical protein